MKKDIFNNNIKHEYISYIWASIFIFAFILIGCGSLLIYAALQKELGTKDRSVLMIIGVLAYLCAILHSFLTIFVIRKYPRYTKIRKLFLDSDFYFAESDSHDFHGHWLKRPAFDTITRIAEGNKGLESIKYPKKYYAYIWCTVIGIVLIFVNLAVSVIILENIEVLPKVIQNEVIIFTVFMVAEVFYIVLSFVFAFRVKKTRETTIGEYREKQRINNELDNQK
ncbi:MAG: hypothetical protein J6B54_04750 [Clostridia bacterium]|nr:hypothetical protein [Clostridia bacterium]